MPGNDAAAFLHYYLRRIAQAEQLGSCADGCKRISQLMREHRQELVFALIGLQHFFCMKTALAHVQELFEHGQARQVGSKTRTVLRCAFPSGAANRPG